MSKKDVLSADVWAEALISNKEIYILDKIFKNEIPSKFSDKIKLAVIDSFAQFSQNPTSKSAGYGVKENYPLIEDNLRKRYKLSKVVTNNIISFLNSAYIKMKEINHDIYFWRKAIADYIKENYVEEFNSWYDSLYKSLDKNEKIKFLFLLTALKYTSSIKDIHKWFFCFFDKEEKLSEDEFKDLLIEFGLGNLIYYRSSSGYSENQFVPFLLFEKLYKNFKAEIPIENKQIEEIFSNLSLSNLKLMEKCILNPIPILESKMGKVTQTHPLIIETSKSYSAISPFALNKFRELIKVKKLELTMKWKKELDAILNSFIINVYPLADLRVIFEVDGAYCWEIKYTYAPDKELISIGILLSPYIFQISSYSTVLDEMRRCGFQLNLIFLIKETLPTLAESFRFVTGKNLIFLLDEKGEKFYLIERSEKISEDKELLIASFLSRFLSILEKKLQISRTWPSSLIEYIENLKYFNRFPRIAMLQNRIRNLQPKLRKTIREKLEKKMGQRWKEEIRKRHLQMVKKLENVIEKRPDKEEIKDFLDGATLGELVEILRSFSNILDIERSEIEHLNIIIKYRKILEHPLKELKDRKRDLDEKVYNKLKIALDYVEEVICLK